jgi:hypothetical protein
MRVEMGESCTLGKRCRLACARVRLIGPAFLTRVSYLNIPQAFSPLQLSPAFSGAPQSHAATKKVSLLPAFLKTRDIEPQEASA